MLICIFVHWWPDSGISISKVFVNFREGEIRPKLCHFRGFFYFRWYCMTIFYFRQIFVVLPKEKLFSIYFRGRYTTTFRREPSPQPFNNTVFVDLNDKLGETGVLVNCPGGGGRRRGRCLPQRQLKTVKTCILFYFIYSFQGFSLNSDTPYASL